MPEPERRTRADLTAVALISALLLTAVAAVWWSSDARSTTLRAAATPGPGTQPPPATAVPVSLAEAWRAPSEATPQPVVPAGTVVTGQAGEVSGRDLVTGEVRWSYRRDLDLCTVAEAFSRVLAVYHRGSSCSEVTALEPAEGARGPQRTGPLDGATRLLFEGGGVIATGERYVEAWRSDLVRTLEYGAVPTPVNPGAQPRSGCNYGSFGVVSGRLGLIERCPGEPADRLTVLRSDPEEADRPEAEFSTLLGGRDADVVELTRDRIAVALPHPARLVVLDGKGRRVAEHPLQVPAADLRGDPPGGVARVTAGTRGSYWFTGSSTVALSTDLRPLWIVPGTLGPGTVVAGRLLVPVPGGLAVLDTRSGRQLGLLPVDRGGWSGPVATASVSGVVLEQRGETLVALR
ncbi:MAG: Rv3212 family protein [Pseudonocardiaceae bacterium]